MLIYFNTTKSQVSEQQIKKLKIPAHEKIGALFAKARDMLKSKATEQEAISSLFKQLGVSPEDKEAVNAMSQLLSTLGDGSLKVATTDNSGIFFIQKKLAQEGKKKTQFENVAVFKIGRKRAAMETMARFLANSLGLNKQMIPGMFCALQNPVFDPNEDTIEELWNGLDKVYFTQSAKPKKAYDDDDLFELDPLHQLLKEEEEENEVEETARSVVGIIQPFLFEQTEASLYEYTLMTMLALAIGLRDGKKDGYKGSTLFDVEDCMPIRIDPIWTKEKMADSPSAIDLPYLDQDNRTSMKLSMEDVGRLAELVQKWNAHTIVQNLSRLKIRYEDKVAEKIKAKGKGTDEGLCSVEIVTGELHKINGRLNHLNPSNKRHILLPEQLEACNTRLQRIRDFILDCARTEKRFTPQQLVFGVDKYGQMFHDAIQESPQLPRSISDTMIHYGFNHITGQTSPRLAKVDAGVYESFSRSSSNSPSPSLRSSIDQFAHSVATRLESVASKQQEFDTASQ